METPNGVGKNRPRRSLSLRTSNKKRSHQGDTVDSPELAFGASPNLTTSASDSRLNNLECSTPVNSNRKRSFFHEDGSPYVDSSMDMSGLHHASPVPFTMSQEMRRIGVDVVWQWNSPKRNANNDDRNNVDDPIPMARKRRKSFTITRSAAKEAAGNAGRGTPSSGTDKATGFYKIRDDLLKAKKQDSLFMRLMQEDIPAGAVEETHRKAVCPEGEDEQPRDATNDPDATLTRKLSDDYLNDDSENDENLLIVSQETEKKVMELAEQEQRERKMQLATKTPSSVVLAKEMNFTNDSFDQYLIDIPFDELLNRNVRNLDQTVVNTASSSSSASNSAAGGAVSAITSKGSLNRTLSLPTDTEQIMVGILSGGSRAMSRHESMPTTTSVQSPFSASDPKLTMSSSTESLYSATSSSNERIRMCTQDEIARKRQIAQERLKCKQQLKNRQRLTQEHPPKR